MPFDLTLTIFDWVELIGHLPFYGAMAFLLVWTQEERDLSINELRNIPIRRAGNALTSSPS